MLRNSLGIIIEDAARIRTAIPDFEFLRGRTVLVTGATGLLGTHFLGVLALLNQLGYKIGVIAQCHSKPAAHTEQISRLGRFNLVMGGTYQPIRYDIVIHAAGYAQPAVFTANPAATLKLNTTLTQELLEHIRPGGKFLFVSSSEVYSGLGGLVTESSIGNTTPSHPRACYIEGKRCGEAIVNAYRQSGVDAKSARLGLAYGPGTRKGDQRAMSQFIEQALTTNKIQLAFSGQEPRTFCYVSDAVEMMFQILLHGKSTVYNVGGESVTNMASVAAEIATITKVPLSMPSIESEMPGAPKAVSMDTSRVRSEFGKRDFINLEDGLKRTIDWQRGFYVI